MNPHTYTLIDYGTVKALTSSMTKTTNSLYAAHAAIARDEKIADLGDALFVAFAAAAAAATADERAKTGAACDRAKNAYNEALGGA